MNIPDSRSLRFVRPATFRGLLVVLALSAWIVVAAVLGWIAIGWVSR